MRYWLLRWGISFVIACEEFPSMIGEDWQLVTDEPVEFEKLPAEVQDFKKLTDQFRGNYKVYPNLR